MSDAFGDSAEDEPTLACRGRRPHLRDFEPTGCQEHAKTILLGASNSWFGITLSALSIPTHVDKLPQLVEERWVILQHLSQREFIGPARAMGNLKGLEEHSDEDVWTAIDAKRSGSSPMEEDANLKLPEWKILSAADPARNAKDFHLTPVAPPLGFEKFFVKVVKVERLREVRALTGFTRIESPGDYADPGEIPANLKAPLTRGLPSWVELLRRRLCCHHSRQRWESLHQQLPPPLG